MFNRNAKFVVVAEVNRRIGDLLGIRLEVIRWENDSYPGFHALLSAHRDLWQGWRRGPEDLCAGFRRLGGPVQSCEFWGLECRREWGHR
jgi:hypothetical protein